MHCFFTCPYAKKVWELIPLCNAVHLAAGSSFKDVIVKFRKATCLPPSGITLNVLPWVLWAICTARNSLIFEDRRFTPEETALKGIKLAKEWATAQVTNNEGRNTLLSHRDQDRQPPRTNPDNTRVICKTDAAWNEEKLVAGLGWVFSGPTIETPISGSVAEASIGSPLIAEAFAVRSALCVAINLEFNSIELFSDNLTLVRAISGKSQVKEIIGIVKDIRSISSELASFSFSHISRSQNSIADSLAKEALQTFLSL